MFNYAHLFRDIVNTNAAVVRKPLLILTWQFAESVNTAYYKACIMINRITVGHFLERISLGFATPQT